jgi:DNA-binding PadR family transcriptional regulator
MVGKKSTDEPGVYKLSPVMFNILVVLSGGDRHGYAILREVEELSGTKAKAGPTTLYRTLRTLIDAGLITESAKRPSAATDDERRRYYRLTVPGKKVLNDEVQRLERLLNTARANGVLITHRRTT